MTKQQFFDDVKQLSQDIQTYANLIPIAYKDFAVARITVDRDNVYLYIAINDWNGLIQHCQSKINQVNVLIQLLETEQTKLNTLMQRLFALKTCFKAHYRSPKTQVNWQIAKKAIEDAMNNAGTNQTDIDAFVNKIGSTGGLNAYTLQKKQIQNIANMLDYAFERHLSLYMYYYMGIKIAEFNLKNATTQLLTYNVTLKISNLFNTIESKNNAIYLGIKANNINEVIDNCNSADIWLDTNIDDFIVPILACVSQTRKTSTSDFTIDGRRALKASELLQNALFAKSSCKWLKWNIVWHLELKEKIEIIAAVKLANSDILQQEQLLTINDLLINGNYNGKNVLIEGVIKDLKILHLSATKVLSIAEIENAQSVTVKLVLPHIKLDSGGLVVGAYAKISGKFLVANPEAKGQPAISVARMAIAVMAKSNWQAWLRNKQQTIYQPTAHNLSTSFSIEAGSYGAINPVKFDTTYTKPNLLKIKTNF